MIKIKTTKQLGDNVIFTGLIKSLQNKSPKQKIFLDTPHPELFRHFKNIEFKKSDSYDIDLTGYFQTKHHQENPPKPLYVHAIQTAEAGLKTSLKIFEPEIILSEKELSWAKKKLSKYHKPTIWIQTKTSSKNKNWNNKKWKTLLQKISKQYNILELNEKYSLRQSLAITKESFGGIVLDSFLLHGSQAVGAKNVIAILTSSRKEVVSYPIQQVVQSKSACKFMPCGLHKGHLKGTCYHGDFRCVKKITVQMVLQEIEKWQQKKSS